MRKYKYVILDEPQDKLALAFANKVKVWNTLARTLDKLQDCFVPGKDMIPQTSGSTITWNRNAR